jgi:L-asparaginase II
MVEPRHPSAARVRSMTNPILVDVTRGPLVESFHRGAVAVMRADGTPVLALGDVTRPVFPRSAIKVVQALPLIETGAADRFGFGERELALACGSHSGTDAHVAVARGMLDQLGLDVACLACGAMRPAAPKAALALAARGEAPSALHHGCSGKHAGLLATALALGAPAANYTAPGHPAQMEVRAALHDLTGRTLDADVCGLDGCSVPSWAISLAEMARMFAKFASGEGLSSERCAAVGRIFAACWAHPDLIAGAGRADTVVMAALPGQVFMKTGVEGVYCGAVPAHGVGFAIKIDDGAGRASAAAVMPLIERLVPQARGLVSRAVLFASNGAEAGRIRCAIDYERALHGLTA